MSDSKLPGILPLMSTVEINPSPISLPVLAASLQAAKDEPALFSAIVNAPFQFRKETVKMSLGILVLLQVNKAKGTIDRIALSDNELAKGSTDMSAKKFKEIHIPVDDSDNSIAKAIRSGEPQLVADWAYLFTPVLTPEQARLNQAGGGIGCSVVYPIIGARNGGAMIFSYFKYPNNITAADHAFMRGYIQLVASQLGSTS
jgi:hypothetical protein